ncbi:hypothetical protein [Desulfovibrio sp. JC022]|uniref:hypothetical protein n=1 Tax=Desulfovibrio sp. JC022 TaxID=2593642 RepID=UPI0013D8705F|nr:hypothetical protein [Desulfovibrio sp. JC022]NDV22182.1 hypothetical protein [Desulfovibrio sp. JC022]
MNVSNERIIDFLGRLDTLLKRGNIVYRQYLDNEKQLLFAKVIKDNNMRIRELVLAYTHILPEVHQANAIDLVVHVDVWNVLWEDLFASKDWNLCDSFVFENKVNFPRESVDSLIKFYQEQI